MKLQYKRDAIAEMYEDAIILEDPAFDRSIVGVTTNGEVIYDLDRMEAEFAEDTHCTREDAAEFISVNTIRAIPYMGEGHPIVIETKL